MAGRGVPFSGNAAGGIEALAPIAGVRFDLLFRDFDAIVTAFRKGMPVARERFGPDVPFGSPRWAAISYGHINCLGSPLRFPQDSEVAHTPIYGSLAEGIRALSAETDFARSGLFPFYLGLWERLKREFPEEGIGFGGFGAEGPLTTAWLLRGHDFWMDLYDDPPAAKRYLELVTTSVVRYIRFLAKLNGNPEVSPHGSFLVDDGAAMVPPPLWPEFVMPYLHQCFSGLTTGERMAHIEDLHVEHLHFLDELPLSHYDPSVSRRLTPALIRDGCRVPFFWRLNETDYDWITPRQTAQWVLEAAADGATGVRTGVWRNNTSPAAARCVHAFLRASRAVADRLAAGAGRDELRGLIGELEV